MNPPKLRVIQSLILSGSQAEFSRAETANDSFFCNHPKVNPSKRTHLLSRINIVQCVHAITVCVTWANLLAKNTLALQVLPSAGGLTRGTVAGADRQCFWGGSSVGRALRSQCRGREFDSPPLHSFPAFSRLVESAAYLMEAIKNCRDFSMQIGMGSHGGDIPPDE